MQIDKSKTVDQYIALFPEDKQLVLKSIRSAIQEVAPNAEECISYQIPTYKQNGILLSFAAFEKHIGFYPTPSGIEKFKSAFSEYKSAKGSVQFPMDKTIPLDLIKEITRFRVKENT